MVQQAAILAIAFVTSVLHAKYSSPDSRFAGKAG